ncbi:TnsA-like heteromeric transposase endonuclease subunit [Streptomyces sp. NBC_01571]|uniref:TnsA-like heteromeric transposase endonuclease subunit n=1 Tax=Streptomyces sp. NBC_01571 TaxID=2975883 RepID=UPI002259BC47|nr:TnsA-like heteromeric transposase endonuclease subunit [Streptomyces sp. NBC_01571]MCX4581410.1 TnsA-like heteromeric transposase endonuclease subunit [Streptomyces sp. NBC_01571]
MSVTCSTSPQEPGKPPSTSWPSTRRPSSLPTRLWVHTSRRCERGSSKLSSQPFWLHWDDGRGRRRHAPDYFVRLAAGRARVVDVRAEDDMDDRTREAFAATERACEAVGWEFEWAGRPDPVFMANVRWLSRYRRARSGRPEAVAERLLEVFSEPRGLWEGSGRVGDRIQVLPVLFHLLWSGKLKADLSGGLLETGSLVWAKGRQRWAG